MEGIPCSSWPGLGESISLCSQGSGLALPTPWALRGLEGVLKEQLEWYCQNGKGQQVDKTNTQPPFLCQIVWSNHLHYLTFQDLLVQQIPMSLAFYTHNSLVPWCLFSSVFVLQTSIYAIGPKYHLFAKLPFRLPLLSLLPLFYTPIALWTGNQELNSLARIRSWTTHILLKMESRWCWIR